MQSGGGICRYGDLNAKVGREASGSVIRNFGLDERNERGDK